MTVEFELEDEEAVRMLQDLLGWSMTAMTDGYGDEADETMRIIEKLIEQAEGQIEVRDAT